LLRRHVLRRAEHRVLSGEGARLRGVAGCRLAASLCQAKVKQLDSGLNKSAPIPFAFSIPIPHKVAGQTGPIGKNTTLSAGRP